MNPETEEAGAGDRGLVSTRAVEIGVAAVLFAFGAVFAYSSWKLGNRWGIEGPQSGFFPFYVSLIICGSAASVLFHAIRAGRAHEQAPFVLRGQFAQVLKMAVPATLYVLGVQLIGIYVSSAIYIAFFMRWLGRYAWWRSIAISVVIIVSFFFMFEVWFQVPLYKGIWDLTAWTGY
ncbi:MAG: tripartite tricarboxylate transporter TctB family protein [Proteobacteria bacterium]|nr:tripartite tricarboxylate transporter TctB family protein [Pseudomonadota bacterium]